MSSGVKKILEQRLGLHWEDVLSWYHKSRPDWHPVGRADSIKDSLQKVEQAINEQLVELNIRFELPPDDFLTDPDATKRFIKKLTSSPLSLLVIDPLATLNRMVPKRLILFTEVLKSSRSAIMVLPPFNLPDVTQKLKEWLIDEWQTLFDPYFDPPIPPSGDLRAQCGFDVCDENDIKRRLLLILGQHLKQGETTSIHPILKHNL